VAAGGRGSLFGDVPGRENKSRDTRVDAWRKPFRTGVQLPPPPPIERLTGRQGRALSASGDLGGALIPWSVGALADRVSASPRLPAALDRLGVSLTPDQAGLRAAFCVAALFPVLIALLFRRLGRSEAGR